MRELDEALSTIDAALAEGDLAAAQRALARCVALVGDEDPDVAYARACIVWEQDGSREARPHLLRAIDLDPEHADAHYALAREAEERGDRRTMVEHLLRVLKLDARADRAARVGNARELDHIEGVAREVLASLPSPFVERLEHVPIVLERRPSPELVKTGFDPRALGLFEGATDGDMHTMAPTRIVLFVNNLLADFPRDPLLSEQIEITLLHEIGHYFNLDEDDMVRLGLD